MKNIDSLELKRYAHIKELWAMKSDLIQISHIEPIRVLRRYETGIVEWYECNNLSFHWFSWLLCEVAHAKTNPVHHLMCSSFREQMKKDDELCHNVEMSIWNPAYENAGEEYFKLNRLWYWKPIQIVLLDP